MFRANVRLVLLAFVLAAACNRGPASPAAPGGTVNPTNTLEGELRTTSATAGDVRVQVVVHNRGTAPVDLPSPVMATAIPPEAKWTWAPESYQTALLLSFNLMTMTVTGPSGAALPSQGPATWSTTVRPNDRTVQPGGKLELTIVLSDFYELSAGETYQVAVDFGEDGRRVHAEGAVTVGQ